MRIFLPGSTNRERICSERNTPGVAGVTVSAVELAYPGHISLSGKGNGTMSEVGIGVGPYGVAVGEDAVGVSVHGIGVFVAGDGEADDEEIEEEGAGGLPEEPPV
jgi:hypothetical protein